MASSGNDIITGTSGSDNLNGGAGNDTISGGNGNDRINGGADNDTLNGGAGSDTVSGDSGADLLIFDATDMTGASIDNYDGGAGIDRLQLKLTHDVFVSGGFQSDLAGYLAFRATHTLSNGEVDNAKFTFTFASLGLSLNISKIEQLQTSINLSSLNGNGGFKLSGEAGGDTSGYAVAGAGDVNGDGFDDLIIGAYGGDPHGSASGASYVVFGKASGFSDNFQLSTLDGTNGFQINGEATLDRSGRSVAGAGDVNGDGFGDLIISSDNRSGSYNGAYYVVFGHAGGFVANLDLSTLDGTNGFQINGEAADDSGTFLGTTFVSSAGDVNGDGFDDVIIGADGADPNGSDSGASYVVFGKASGFSTNLDLSTLDGTNGFQISGETAFDRSGQSVASAGDVNGDGFDDLIIGAFTADPSGAESGASYVVFGHAGGFPADLELANLNGTNGFQISGGAAADSSGFSVASAGDVNADGYDDLILGAIGADTNGNLNTGASYVVFGTASGFSANLDLSVLNGSNGFKISGEETAQFSGWSVAGAGDVNGDGIEDLIIGAKQANSNGMHSGASYVVFGQASGFGASLDLATLDGTNGFKLNGEAAGDGSGTSVGSAGDVNGDGFDDLFIGAPHAAANGPNSGASYVMFGGNFTGAVTQLGTAVNDAIVGTSGNDIIFGAQGDDILTGGGGNDQLNGAIGNDTFVFALGSGADTIVDFSQTTNDTDLIDVSAYNFTDFADLLTHMSAIGTAGVDTLIDLGGGNSITLQDVAFSSLIASDFFV